jgi:hypothetical protein
LFFAFSLQSPVGYKLLFILKSLKKKEKNFFDFHKIFLWKKNNNFITYGRPPEGFLSGLGAPVGYRKPKITVMIHSVQGT